MKKFLIALFICLTAIPALAQTYTPAWTIVGPRANLLCGWDNLLIEPQCYTPSGWGLLTDITGLILEGTGIDVSGSGTSLSPYIISNTGVTALNLLTGAVGITSSGSISVGLDHNNITLDTVTGATAVVADLYTITGTGTTLNPLVGTEERYVNQTTNISLTHQNRGTIFNNKGGSLPITATLDSVTAVIGDSWELQVGQDTNGWTLQMPSSYFINDAGVIGSSAGHLTCIQRGGVIKFMLIANKEVLVRYERRIWNQN